MFLTLKRQKIKHMQMLHYVRRQGGLHSNFFWQSVLFFTTRIFDFIMQTSPMAKNFTAYPRHFVIAIVLFNREHRSAVLQIAILSVSFVKLSAALHT